VKEAGKQERKKERKKGRKKERKRKKNMNGNCMLVGLGDTIVSYLRTARVRERGAQKYKSERSEASHTDKQNAITVAIQIHREHENM